MPARETKKRAAAATTASSPPSAAVQPEDFICNLVPSRETDRDWALQDALAAGAVTAPRALPASVDLRKGWWSIHNQEDTGSCVGWATADGAIRWSLVDAGVVDRKTLLSPRHLWMASKETDEYSQRPESFVEEAGTSLKAALDVARKHGVALMEQLPFHIRTKMYVGREQAFYASCAQRKIRSYFNLRLDLDAWKHWLATTGPLVAGLSVDASWDSAGARGGKVDTFKPNTVRGGHAVCVVGYRSDGRFIVRNSWGTGWGDHGFAYVSRRYLKAAFFDEAYGVKV